MSETLGRDYLLEPLPADGLQLPIHVIMADVSFRHGITYEDLISERRDRKVTNARQEGYWLARKHTTASLPQIARAFKRDDHTTIAHGIRAHEKRMGG